MLGYPCCPAVPAVNAPFQALSVQYLLKAEQTCIASVAPRLAWRMHWRLDEYGAESSRWRRLQQGCRFPRKKLLLQTTVPIATIHTVAWPAALPVSQSHSPWQLSLLSANTVELVYDESAALSDCAKANQNQRCSHYPQAAPPACLLAAHGPRGKVPRHGRLAGERLHLGIMVLSAIDLWNRHRLPAVKLPLLPSILLLHAPSASAPLLPSICISQAVRNSPTTCLYIYAVSQHLHLARSPIIGARRLSDRLTS
jgi:hypothetical protein